LYRRSWLDISIVGSGRSRGEWLGPGELAARCAVCMQLHGQVSSTLQRFWPWRWWMHKDFWLIVPCWCGLTLQSSKAYGSLKVTWVRWG